MGTTSTPSGRVVGRLRELLPGKPEDASRTTWVADVVSLLGMALPFTLVSRLNMAPAGLGGTPLGGPYPWLVLVCAAVALAAPRLARRADGGRSLPCRALDALACLALGLGCVGLQLGAAGAAAWACAASGGAAVGWLYVRWGVAYSRLGLRSATGCICAAVMLASLQKLALSMAGPAARVALICAIVPCGWACLSRASRLSGTADQGAREAEGGRHALRDLWLYPIALAALCAILGCLYHLPVGTGASSPLSITWGYVIEFAAALAVFAWVGLARRSVSGPGVVAALSFVIATGLLLLQALSGAAPAFFLLTNVDHSLLTLFLWIALCDLSHWFSDNPWRVFGCGWALRSAAFWASGALTSAAVSQVTPAVYASLAYAVTAVLVLVLAGRNATTASLFGELYGRADAGAATLERRCAEVGSAHGLTPREVEVMALLCQGRTRPYIAETFCLSENTVRGHVKQIYKKCGVHTRQDLFALVDATPPAGGRFS